MRRLNADQSTRKLRRGAGLDHDAPKKEKRNETRFRRWCLISPFLAFREGGTKLKLLMLLQREQDRFSYHIKPKFRSASSCVCEYIWYSCSPFGSKTRKLQTYLPKHPLLGRTYITRNPVLWWFFTERGVKYRLIAVYSAKERVQQIHNMTKKRWNDLISNQTRPSHVIYVWKFFSIWLRRMDGSDRNVCLFIYLHEHEKIGRIGFSISLSFCFRSLFTLRCVPLLCSASHWILGSCAFSFGFWGAMVSSIDDVSVPFFVGELGTSGHGMGLFTNLFS